MALLTPFDFRRLQHSRTASNGYKSTFPKLKLELSLLKFYQINILCLMKRYSASILSQYIFYRLETVWVFTFSGTKTIVFERIVFGFSGTLAGPPIMTGPLSCSSVVQAPYMVFRTWSTLLPFDINNQNHRDTIAKDAINKP